MKIAIQHSDLAFSQKWIEYCRNKSIDYKIVNCYANNIIEQLKDCDALMWHHHHAYAKDTLFAKQLLFSLEHAGKKVFPDFRTGWHFDDKVGQKYLLEAIGAPLVPSYIFYSKREALEWANTTKYPKVFKLRTGAGSYNVFLVKSQRTAKRMIRRSFSRGFSPYNKWINLKDTYKSYRKGKNPFLDLLKSLRRVVYSTQFARIHGNEKGYAYFQDFLPDNTYDIRVVVIGNKAFAIKRIVRKKDFRASGSGNILHSKDQIDERCVSIAFEVSAKLGAQCLAYDFIFDSKQNPLITEINYGFDRRGYLDCPGYWDINLEWHEKQFYPEEWMVETLFFPNK
ncbi:MAG: hypothetical protein SCM96_15185 [Acidobacteriota bacterium]|nr:hypothetical protein [Acidobacteriota bacterium]